MHETFKSDLFVGLPDCVLPVHNVKAVASNTYFIMGKMISTCIIQDGEVPVHFMKPVADYIPGL